MEVAELFDIDSLDEDDPFEIDSQAAHLFKHAPFGMDDVFEVWQSDPLFYPAIPPAHWLMVAQTGSDVLVVPLAPPDSGEVTQCRPIGCCRGEASRRPLPGGPMTKKMTRTEEQKFYDNPDNQTPQGPARRRKAKLTELVPVRFPPDTLDKVRTAADADDRSVSSWIRRAVEHELEAETA